MNKFFKVSLVAAAIAVTGTATAGQFDKAGSVTAPVVFSAEGIDATASTAQYAGAINYILGAAYTIGNDIAFTFSAGSINSATKFPAEVVVATGTIGAGGTTSTFALNSASGDTVSYRLISTATGVDTTGLTKDLFSIAQAKSTIADLTDSTKVGVVLNTSAVKAASVTVTAASVASGVAFDADTTKAGGNVLAKTATEIGTFAVTGTGFDTIIDTATGSLGKIFKLPATSSALTVTYSAPAETVPTVALLGADAGLNKLAATKITTTLSIKGDFSSFDKADALIAAAAGTVNYTATGLDIVLPAGADPVGDTVTVTPDVTKNSALIAQGFTVTPTVAFNSKTNAQSVMPAGAWTVDDEMASVAYMPFGTGITQILYITNTDAKDAKVAVTATDENGVKYSLGTLVTAKGNGKITKITEEVRAALLAQGFSKGKVALDFMFVGVTTANKVKVYSAYNVNGTDRGFVANSTN